MTKNILQTEMTYLNALLCAGLFLQLNKSSRELSLGLLVLWVGLMFTRALWITRSKPDANAAKLLFGSALGITLIQARTITQRDDEQGITQFLLISAGLLAGASLNTKEARTAVKWAGVTSAIISGLLLISLFWNGYSFTGANFVAMYETIFREGFGDQNSLRIVLPILSAASIAAARLSESKRMQGTMLAGTTLSYVAIVATSSRMAMVAPVIGCALAWLIDKWSLIRQQGRRFWILTCMTALTTCSVAAWTLVIAPDLATGMQSDAARTSIWGCWLRSIFSGDNRFLMGFGHDAKPISKQCTDIAIGVPTTDPLSASGHAHNTIINIAAHHGILGLTSLAILGLLYWRGLSNHQGQAYSKTTQNSLWSSSWNEASLTIGITLFICAMSNTVYNQNQALNLLIGLVLSMPLCKPFTPTQTQSNSQPFEAK